MAQHLIHIGYPKAGSTFLQSWFERHPQLHYAPGGLGGFHDVYSLARPANRACKYYVTSFEGLSMPHETAGRLRLDFGLPKAAAPDPVKTHQADACALLHDLYPRSQILIVTRGFKSMVMSAYSQSVRMGARRHLHEMCEELSNRLDNESQHYFDYDYLIGLYKDTFGSANVVVVPYELLRDDSKHFLRLIETRLGLQHLDFDPGPINPSLSPHELYWYPVISRLVADMALRFGNKAYNRIYGWYVGKTLENRLRPLITLLRVAAPKKKITEVDFFDSVLSRCKGRATFASSDPLYASYRADYLCDDDRKKSFASKGAEAQSETLEAR